MDTVRDLVLRLAGFVSGSKGAPPGGPLNKHHRRVVVPWAALFSMDQTFFRTAPIEPIEIIKRPGGTNEAVQLLEWLDDAGASGAVDPRDNEIGTDLAAILALACGRKVAFAAETPIGLPGAQDSVWFMEIGQMFDTELYGPVELDVLSNVVKTSKALATLPQKKALALGGAIRMRNAACCLLDSDSSSAYGLMVVALECLSRAFGNPPTLWHNWEQSDDWDSFIRRIRLNEEQAAKLRDQLLSDRQVRLKQTFAEYILESLREDFWSSPYLSYTPAYQIEESTVRALLTPPTKQEHSMQDLVPVDRDLLRDRIRKSYDGRSQVFHQGERLNIISMMPAPINAKVLLPFAGLRRITDYLLWREIDNVAAEAGDLPDVKLLHPEDSTDGPERQPA